MDEGAPLEKDGVGSSAAEFSPHLISKCLTHLRVLDTLKQTKIFREEAEEFDLSFLSKASGDILLLKIPNKIQWI